MNSDEKSPGTPDLSVTTRMLAISSPAAKEWFNQRRQTIRSWADFANTKKFEKPGSIKDWSSRAVKNVEYFQTNYLFVFIGLIVYCIVTSPLMLIAIAVFLGACYIINIKNEQQKIKIMGHELSYAQQYGAAAALSFPLFFLAGAGSAVFWVLGVSFFLIAMHASFHIPTDQANTEEPFMETV